MISDRTAIIMTAMIGTEMTPLITALESRPSDRWT
jgi:hypothetical protein